jgi:hypothetical protein
MVCRVRRRHGMSGGASGGDLGLSCSCPRGRMRSHRCLHRSAGGHLTVRPGARNFESSRRTRILTVLGEERQNALRAIRSPARQERVIRAIERPAAVDGDKSAISHASCILARNYARMSRRHLSENARAALLRPVASLTPAPGHEHADA